MNNSSAEQQQSKAFPWETKHMPCFHGKVAIVTGSNSGIGFVTALELVRKGAHVVLACRNQHKAEDAIQRIHQQLQEDVHAQWTDNCQQMTFLPLDLSDLQSVRDFARSFKSRFNKLHLLVNNAGVMNMRFETTLDGLEKTFVTNHLGHFLLTCLLFDTMNQSGTVGNPVRVVHVSSVMHAMSQPLDLEQLNNADVLAKKYEGSQQYSMTKLCNLLFCFELDRRLQAANKLDRFLSIGCHPGASHTKFMEKTEQTITSSFFRLLYAFAQRLPLYQSAEMGALPTLFAATSHQALSGAYYGPNGTFNLWGPPAPNEPSTMAKNQEMASKLWDISEQLAQCKFEIK